LLKRQNRFRRFAWPYPWATLMGWPGETYGDRLLRIELKPCQTARVRFTTAGAFDHSFGEGFAGVTGTWSQTDRVNTIGAVYHEHVTHYRPPQNSYQPWGSSLREYVLFSETHIARFSHGDPACLAALRADIAFLNQVKSALAQFNEDAGAGGFPKRIKTVDDRWRANLAFHNGDYAPRVQAVDAVIKALRDALKTQGPPLVRG
jgi:hypothetical protein